MPLILSPQLSAQYNNKVFGGLDREDYPASCANASAVLYSLIETAKANNLTPFNYLMFLLEELPKQAEDLDHLMPWNADLDTII
jgi:hypothetical protein